MSFQTSSSSHIRSRRQHVAYPGNSFGIADHCAPVFRIHRIPSKHSRSLRQGRPRPSLRRGNFGRCGSIRAHCSSVIRIMANRGHNPGKSTSSIYEITSRKRYIWGLALCSIALAIVLLKPLLWDLEENLLAKGVINKKKLWPIIGDERGSIGDYMLNIWHWDGAIFLLGMASLLCYSLGLWLLLSGFWRSRHRRTILSGPSEEK